MPWQLWALIVVMGIIGATAGYILDKWAAKEDFETACKLDAYKAVEQLDNENEMTSKERAAAFQRIKSAMMKSLESVQVKIGGKMIAVDLTAE